MTKAGAGVRSAREATRARLAALRNTRAGEAAGVPRRPDPATAPLSPEQEGLWFIEQVGVGAGAYNLGKTVRLTGRLDLDRLRLAAADVVDRHEALRTSIVERGGRPVQLIAEAGRVQPDIDVVDLTAGSLAVAERLAAELAAAPYRLERAPMLRAAVLRLAETDHLLLLGAHHVICDGHGLMVLVEELGACYEARVRGRVPALPKLTVHFPDYAHWQQQRLAGELGERQRAYWAERLAGAPPALELPADRPRPARQTFAGGRLATRADQALADRLRRFAAGQRCTVPMVLLAALDVALTRYSGQTDVVVGMPVARRTRELQGAIGMFANTVALRTDTAGNPAVRELLARVRRTFMGALANADLPFDTVAATARRERSLSHNPLFQVMLVPAEAAYDAATEPDLPAEHGLRGLSSDLDRATAVVDLTWVVRIDDLATHLDFNTDLYDTPTIRRLARHLRQLLLAFVDDPDRRIWDLPMLTGPERVELGALARGPVPAEPACVLESFVEQASRTPDAVAVLSLRDGRSMTYRELEQRSRAVANRLRQLGCGPERRVGLLLPAGVDAVVAVLATLRAGAAYVPLDPALPPPRLTELLADAGTALVITAPGVEGSALTTDDPAFHGAGVPGELPPVRAAQLAYVIYTSGTTGEPKGVMVEHGSLRNLTAAFRDLHDFGPGQRLLAVPPLSFDASAGCLFPALASGVGLVLHPDPAALTGPGLLALAREHGITAVNCPSPLWQRWASDLGGQPQPDSPLSLVLVGGDRVPLAAERSWSAATRATTTLFNHYGPTEATVCATVLRVGGRTVPDGSGYLPIGRPLPGVTAHVLDEAMNPLPVGVPGELYLGGAAPARGYLGRPSATAERFVPDPFATEPGARLYRTGDLARFWSDGQLEFVGRRDGQVKIRGHRVELAGVESALAKHPAVRAVAVTAPPDRAGLRRLVAYVVPASPGAPPDLRDFARGRLPDYLAPSVFVTVERLPVTAHGKVDKAALPPVEDLLAERPCTRPRTGTERRLATIWSAALGGGRVGRADNFFEIGGHSLLAASVMIEVRAWFSVDLPVTVLFDTADLAELAAVIEDAAGGPGCGPGHLRPEPDLRAEAELAADVCAGLGDLVTFDREVVLRPSTVLVTGATGFLGGYLLADLLANLPADVLADLPAGSTAGSRGRPGPMAEPGVVCLVRAESAEQAASRVRANLRRYGLWRPEYAARLTCLPGDLGAPRLGLDEATFDALAREVDAIYHCGGAVDHVRPYRQLAPVNVGGTVEVLRLAGRNRPVPVHLVSTLGVFLGDKHAGATVLEVDEPAPDGLRSGYEQSKWVADAMARQARERGLPVSIYRPARVAGDGRTGAGNVGDYFSRLVRTVVELGTVPAAETLPAGERHADLAPVDHVAAAIGALSRMPHALGRDHHLYNGRTLGLAEFTATLRLFGYDVREVPAPEWSAAVAGSGSPLSLFVHPTGRSRPRPEFDCRFTEALLVEAGLVCPPADADLLRRYLHALVRAGELPVPGKRS